MTTNPYTAPVPDARPDECNKRFRHSMREAPGSRVCRRPSGHTGRHSEKRPADTPKVVTAECQVCARQIGAASGVIAHHGYKRPSEGWQTTSCMGAREVPYSESCEMTRAALESVERHLAHLEKRIADVESGAIPIHDTRSAWTEGRRVTLKAVIQPGAAPGYVTYMQYPGEADVGMTTTSMSQGYKAIQGSTLSTLHSQVRATREQKAWFEERIAAWYLGIGK